jgi:hypothetical protein
MWHPPPSHLVVWWTICSKKGSLAPKWLMMYPLICEWHNSFYGSWFPNHRRCKHLKLFRGVTGAAAAPRTSLSLIFIRECHLKRGGARYISSPSSSASDSSISVIEVPRERQNANASFDAQFSCSSCVVSSISPVPDETHTCTIFASVVQGWEELK